MGRTRSRGRQPEVGWDAEPGEDAFYGDCAPTAGPAPLHLYELVLERVFGFGTDESLNAMRWTFD